MEPIRGECGRTCSGTRAERLACEPNGPRSGRLRGRRSRRSNSLSRAHTEALDRSVRRSIIERPGTDQMFYSAVCGRAEPAHGREAARGAGGQAGTAAGGVGSGGGMAPVGPLSLEELNEGSCGRPSTADWVGKAPHRAWPPSMQKRSVSVLECHCQAVRRAPSRTSLAAAQTARYLIRRADSGGPRCTPRAAPAASRRVG